MSADQENPGDMLASIAQQVAQASKTTALHIKQHDDIEQAAQEKADLVIVKIREELERAHRLAVEHATEALKSSHNHELHRNLTNIAKRFNKTLDDLVSQHRSTLEEHIETLRKADRERAEIYNREAEQVRAEARKAMDEAQAQRRQMENSHKEALTAASDTLQRERGELNERFRQVCSDTTTRVEEMLATALEETARVNDARFTEAAKTIDAQKAETDTALAENAAKWRRTAILLAGAALTATVAAVAALVITLT